MFLNCDSGFVRFKTLTSPTDQRLINKPSYRGRWVLAHEWCNGDVRRHNRVPNAMVWSEEPWQGVQDVMIYDAWILGKHKIATMSLSLSLALPKKKLDNSHFQNLGQPMNLCPEFMRRRAFFREKMRFFWWRITNLSTGCTSQRRCSEAMKPLNF